jgi:hypothetical protein
VNKKIALKIDIEGAEFPLFAHKDTIEYLSRSAPLIYIALHPGFKKPLEPAASLTTRTLWRIQATLDVIKFYCAITKYAEIQVASKTKNLLIF